MAGKKDIIMKKGLLFVLLLTTYSRAFAQFYINGIEPFYDSATHTFLMSIDKQLWGKAWTTEVVVRVNSSWNNLRIDGTSVNGTYTFSDIGGDKKFLSGSVRLLRHSRPYRLLSFCTTDERIRHLWQEHILGCL